MIGNWVMENYLPRIADETLKKITPSFWSGSN
jgi:hypothetical protein